VKLYTTSGNVCPVVDVVATAASGYSLAVFVALLFLIYHTWLLHKIKWMHETAEGRVQSNLTSCAPACGDQQSTLSAADRQTGSWAYPGFNSDDGETTIESNSKPGKGSEHSDSGDQEENKGLRQPRRSKRRKCPTRQFDWEERWLQELRL
jgi:hypothetical protein